MKKNPIKSDLRETTAGKVTFLFLLFLYTRGHVISVLDGVLSGAGLSVGYAGLCE